MSNAEKGSVPFKPYLSEALFVLGLTRREIKSVSNYRIISKCCIVTNLCSNAQKVEVKEVEGQTKRANTCWHV